MDFQYLKEFLERGDDRRRRIYISGPMRGYPLDNYPAFDEAEVWLEQNGWIPVSPATIDRTFGVGETPIQELLRRDFAILTNCGAMALLPGWEQSHGANAELVVARYIGLELYHLDVKRNFFERWKMK